MTPLERIAAALERLAPPPPAEADPLAHRAYLWRDGALAAARGFAPLPLALLTGIDAQKAALLANLRRLAAALPAHDALLWGARGSGKSALVKAAVAAVQDERGDGAAALALVEVAGAALGTLPALFARLAEVPRAFAITLDDLGFDGDDAAPRRLRSLLDGGAEARPGNCRLLVTANRRHLVPRDAAEQADPLSPRDAADDRLALADRFGLSLGFHVAGEAQYLAMVEGYARACGLSFEAADAIAWATARGQRSGRAAWHYATELAARHGRRLEPGAARG